MKCFAFLLVLVAIAIQTTSAHNDNFVEAIMHAQDDLKIGHSFFQEQYYRARSVFGVYLNRFSSYMVRGISSGITRFNTVVEETNNGLDEMNASQECEDVWETYQIRFGRSMATCSEYGYGEIDWMVWYNEFMLRWNENYITNNVQTYATSQFSFWNPLLSPRCGCSVISGINTELRSTLDYYQYDYVDYIQSPREYNIGMMDEIIYNVENCANSLVTSFQATAKMFLLNVAAGNC